MGTFVNVLKYAIPIYIEKDGDYYMPKTNPLPLWMQVVGYIVLAVFVVVVIRALYLHFFKTVFGKRRVVEARLVSKVSEPYREPKAYTQARGVGIHAPNGNYNMYYGDGGIAYRLYFAVGKKTVELDVTKEIFEGLKEDSVGLLDYKGDYFYDFKVQE